MSDKKRDNRTKRVTIRLTPGLHADLLRRAAKYDIKPSQYIRDALRKEMHRW